MSTKSKAAAAAALLTAVGGLSTVSAVSAHAATSPAPSTIKVFSAKFGTAAQPNFIETVSHGVARVGQRTVLNPVNAQNKGQDIVGHRGGTVADFFKAGLVSAQVNQHYGKLTASQLELAPNGVRTNLCVGLRTAAFQNEPLSLQSCNTPGTTVFIIDTADSPATAKNGIFPIVSGSTTDFTHPFAMTYYGNPG